MTSIAAEVSQRIAGLVTVAEAARLVGRHRSAVYRWVRRGELVVVNVGGLCLPDPAEVRERTRTAAQRCAPRRPRLDPRVPAGPLLRQIELAGGDYELGIRLESAEKRALERARADGTLTLAMADRLAVLMLGMTAWDLWPEWQPAA